jgi:hypothetical protein
MRVVRIDENKTHTILFRSRVQKRAVIKRKVLIRYPSTGIILE